MGGYAISSNALVCTESLEINGLDFLDSETGKKIELCSIDALYAGMLAKQAINSDEIKVYASSHTHYAPMLDSKKEKLGDFSQKALDCYLKAINNAERVSVSPDQCRIYRADVSVPIYRRFDYPDTFMNRLLAKYFGMYPNESMPIDNGLYIFEFVKDEVALFTIAYYACHPVSRHNQILNSPDYIGAIRNAVRRRFNIKSCLFLLGCSGDLRPNSAIKRVSWLPKCRFNWRFEPWSSASSEARIDSAYADAVKQAKLQTSFSLNGKSFSLVENEIRLKHQGRVGIKTLVVGNQLRFDFLPFEVSHFFHLDAQKKDPLHFIVSCADDVIGYLPHSTQLVSGGYEVDGSRDYMVLRDRVELVSDCL
jgi:hypothetical protein